MTEKKEFKIQTEIKSRDKVHLAKIKKAIATYEHTVTAMKAEQFIDWQQARQKASQIKDYVLNNLPDLLEKFEKNICAHGVHVHWAENADEAQNIILNISKQNQAHKIVKSKSMTTEEIELNDFLIRHELEVTESDLGELIVQLDGEKPYHIVTPAMHKSKKEISELFQEKLGSPASNSAEELAMIAREHLRQVYINADIGITGANFLVADPGVVVITENEGNARLSTSCPPVHIVIAGIEKVLPQVEDLSLFLPLLATSGTGQQITGYNSLFRGPRFDSEIDGPEEMHVILLDNGRSAIYNNPELKTTLKCIRCGACLNACPVYHTVGGHTYHTTYQGPIGSVITPHMKNFTEWHHLSSASSLCAACTFSCPVKIPLHDYLLQNRWTSVQRGTESKLLKITLQLWAALMKKRKVLDIFSGFKNFGLILISPFLPDKIKKRIPAMKKKSFSQLWDKYE